MTTHTKESELTSIFTIWENDHFFWTAVDIIAKKKTRDESVNIPNKRDSENKVVKSFVFIGNQVFEITAGLRFNFHCLFICCFEFFILFLVHTLMHKSYVNC